MGHTVFMMDGAEKKNLIDSNLVILTKKSMSLLNSDQTPASFWIPHPDNVFRNNHAAGSERFGFWFEPQEHPTGESYDVNMCPMNSKLGEFNDNVAHSNGWYGLRIYHRYFPRTFACKDIGWYDEANPDDESKWNMPVTANFNNLVAWKNGRNGAMAGYVGDVRFNNFKTADNVLAGMEMHYLLLKNIDDHARIENAYVVGQSENSEPLVDNASPAGIITPRTEGFQINTAKFANFDFRNAAALKDCS